MYFENFPYTYYTQDDLASAQTIKNILLRVSIQDSIKTNLSLYDEYDILDGETPEIVSDRFYGTPLYHWLVLHLNDILDPRYEWPLSTNNLVKYCQSKYANIDGVHHYEDVSGNWVNQSYPSSTAVSNFTYEDRINEGKRRIKILKPQYLDAVVREFMSNFEKING